jgi:hypothetical protein
MTDMPNTEPRTWTAGMRRPSRLVRLSLLVCLAAAPVSAADRAGQRHPISLTEATVYVQQTRISVALDVFVEDLYLFHNLEPDENNYLRPDDIRTGIELHEQFLLERFVLRDLRGERLQGVVDEVGDLEIPPEGIPMGDLMQHSVTYKLSYAISEPPEFLTVSQEFVDESAGIPAEMQLRLKQEGSDAPSFAVLPPGEPFTVRLSWENPPLSVDASEEEWEEWLKQQREETLGITSYSSVYSFIYIESREVRHEILVPLVTLESSVLIARDDDAFLSLEEQDAAYDQIAAYFKSGNPVEINGQGVDAEVERLDFFGLDFKDFAQQAERRKVSTANARVGIILRYPAKSPPESVKITWDRFNRHIWSVQSIVYAFEEIGRKTFSRFGNEREFNWTGSARVPLPDIAPVSVQVADAPVRTVPIGTVACLVAAPVVLLCGRRGGLPARLLAGIVVTLLVAAALAWNVLRVPLPLGGAPAAIVDAGEVSRVFEQLHRNVYRAFEFGDENAVYDALACSVSGDLLEQLYLQIRKGLEMQEQGGAISRIREVQLLQGELLETTKEAERARFGYECAWTVDGTVEHWGHIHSRTNKYAARFQVSAIQGEWKITDVEVLDQERLKFETKVRAL